MNSSHDIDKMLPQTLTRQEAKDFWASINKDAETVLQPDGSYKSPYDDFIKNASATFDEKLESILTGKLDSTKELLNALENGNWAHPAIHNKNMPYHAAKLYKEGKINFQQIGTLLQFCEIKEWGFCRIFPVFGNGSITPGAEQLFITLFEHLKKRNLITASLSYEKSREFFLNLIQTLPISEQVIFYTIPHNGFCMLDRILNNYGAVYGFKTEAEESSAIIDLSFGVEGALMACRYGLRNFVINRPCLCEQSVFDIEAGMNQNTRRITVAFPGEAFPVNIHNLQCQHHKISVTHHDKTYHTNVVASLPHYFRDALKGCVKYYEKSVNLIIICQMKFGLQLMLPIFIFTNPQQRNQQHNFSFL